MARRIGLGDAAEGGATMARQSRYIGKSAWRAQEHIEPVYESSKAYSSDGLYRIASRFCRLTFTPSASRNRRPGHI
ncbi:MAG TPA: hypothetical protein VGO22_09835, partial [Pseudorhizobium sp.]|nr:hypothetical protein [Pseudorhizobium sp.]